MHLHYNTFALSTFLLQLDTKICCALMLTKDRNGWSLLHDALKVSALISIIEKIYNESPINFKAILAETKGPGRQHSTSQS